MKKFTLLFAFVCLTYAGANAQAAKMLNLGGLGTGLYVGYEIPVSNAITLVPQAATDYEFNKFVLALKGNYYFDELFGIGSEWDVYGGANFGWRIDNGNGDDGVNWGAQIGGRWFWSEKWGLNGEFGGGSGVTGGLGVTMKM